MHSLILYPRSDKGKYFSDRLRKKDIRGEQRLIGSLYYLFYSRQNKHTPVRVFGDNVATLAGGVFSFSVCR